jgi:DNA-binding GntR family transcriptional regulator
LSDPPPAALAHLGEPRETLAARSLEELRTAIVDGRLAPGERFSVAQLAELLGVSRTPVREALLQLERQGVVRFERNRGVRVLETSAHDVQEVFALRLLLEVPATRRACARLREDELGALQHELDEMARCADAGDEAPFMAHDVRFHETLLGAAGNRRLVASVRSLRDHVRYRVGSTVGRTRDLAAILSEHQQIMRALRARDPEAAARAMRDHLRTTGGLLLQQAGGGGAELDDWAG